MIAVLLLLSALAGAAESKSAISEDITIKARAAATGIQVAPPSASKPVIDEVLRSLSLGRGARAPAAERIRAGGDVARFSRPFPEPPFLALSPANIVAVYDEWAFEVLEDTGEIVWKTDGIGMLQERLDWDGSGPNGLLAVIPGRSYRYRFTGRRAGRAFVIESDPVPLRSFSHAEYAGETRLEAEMGLIFEQGKDAFAKDSKQWLEAIASRLRLAEPRVDGSYRLELAMKDLRGPLAEKRKKALNKHFAKALLVPPAKVTVELSPAMRGEAVAALLPPSKGASLRIE